MKQLNQLRKTSSSQQTIRDDSKILSCQLGAFILPRAVFERANKLRFQFEWINEMIWVDEIEFEKFIEEQNLISYYLQH